MVRRQRYSLEPHSITISEARTRLVLSVPEAARLLGASLSWTYAAAERGEIPSRRIRGRLFVPAHELLRAMGDEQAD